MDRPPVHAECGLPPPGLRDRASTNETATSRHGVPPLRPNARPSGRPRAWLQKTPKPPALGRRLPTMVRRLARGTAPSSRGRSPDSRIVAPPSLPRTSVPVAYFGLAPRSQWRDRAGFPPASLFSRDNLPAGSHLGLFLCLGGFLRIPPNRASPRRNHADQARATALRKGGRGLLPFPSGALPSHTNDALPGPSYRWIPTGEIRLKPHLSSSLGANVDRVATRPRSADPRPPRRSIGSRPGR